MPVVRFPSKVTLPLMPANQDAELDRPWTEQEGGAAPLHVEVVGKSDATVPESTAKPAVSDDLYMSGDGIARGTSFALRDYQEEAVKQVFGAWHEGYKAPLIVSPTGSGKTIVAAELMTRMHIRRGARSLFLAHRKELLEQTVEKMRLVSAELGVGLVQSKSDELGRHVTVASIQTVGHHKGKRLQRVLDHGPYDIVVCDEAHHAVTDQWMRVLNTLQEQNPDVWIVGMTATPGRADGVALDRVFDTVAFERQLTDMIRDGWLVPPKGFRVELNVNLDQVDRDSKTGDFVQSQLAKVMNTPQVNTAVVHSWMKYGFDRKTLVYAVDVAHAEALSQEFNDAGYTAEVVHSKTKKRDRTAMLKRFREGKTKLLINVNVLTEGYDEPSAEAVLFARPTQSQTWFIQGLGRGLRLYPTKTDCLVLDCVGNSERHNIVQLSSLAGFEPDHMEEAERRKGDDNEDEDVPVVSGVEIRGRDVDISRTMARTRYQWRETEFGFVLQIPRVGYYLVAWHDKGKTKATVEFYDQRPGRRDDPPRTVLQQPVAFEIAFGLVNSEMDRFFNARGKRKNAPEKDEPDASEIETNFIDLDEGVDEDTYVPEAMMLQDAKWRDQPISDKQRVLLVKLGVKERSIPETMGEASDLIGIMQVRRDAKMRLPATRKQLSYLHLNHLPVVKNMTKRQAARLIWKHRKGMLTQEDIDAVVGRTQA